jgi:chaperonin GroEL
MSAKQFVFDADARHALERGVSVFADAVKLTLGPKGRNALLNRPFGSPVVTNDGVTIAQEIELGDHFENMGAQLIKEVASKTNDLVGDGTTTATVLAQAMVREGLRHVTSGSNPQVIKRGIEQAVNTVLGEMRFFVEPVDSPDKIAQIAGMSANDVAIGRLIADAMEAVGADGAVSVEESRTLTTELTIKTGRTWSRIPSTWSRRSPMRTCS